MASEAGHVASRAYFDQSGNLHLNGASLFDSSENDLKTAPSAVAVGYKIARGVATTATASDTIVTGLTTVVAVVATMQADPIVAAEYVTATIGNQAGAPAAGSFLLNSWKTLGGTPAAATTFSLAVNWIAIGT